METTDGFLLNGRVRYAQPKHGYRTGIEPVLLAAFVPATAGQCVIEAGTGAGAASLCLATRVPELRITAVEHDSGMADLARTNVDANRIDHITVLNADILQIADLPVCDHAFANPPWHDCAGSRSPAAGREKAKRADPNLLPNWASTLAGCLRRGGTLTFIMPASQLSEILSAFSEARCGAPEIWPLWPRVDVEAKLMIVRVRRNISGACRIHPGLVLHRTDGAYTPMADGILRGVIQSGGF